LSPKQLDGLKNLLEDKQRWRKSDELVRLFIALESLGLIEYVQFDPNIVRGLLYYTGTVFEAFDITGGVRRAILGGGRYDNLLQDVGGDPLSGIGFAMGDVVISLILQELGLLPPLPLTPSAVLVTVFSPELLASSLSLAADLRQAGLNVTCYPEPAKLPRQFKFADRMGMRAVVVIGPDEAAVGKVTLKNLTGGTQETISRSDVAASIKRLLESH
jgi:histidyl-tRNA synthetase